MSPVSRLAVFASVVGLCIGVLGNGILKSELNELGAAAREAALDQQLCLLKDRLARKQEIAENLAAGGITLVEAASNVTRLNLPPSFWRMLPESDPARTTEESLCRHILEIAVQQVADPAQAERLQRRLERELEDATDSEGRIMLPALIARPVIDVRIAEAVVD